MNRQMPPKPLTPPVRADFSASGVHREKGKDRKSLGWIIKVSRPQIPTVIAIVLGEAVWAVFGTATALFSKEIINNATSGNKNGMFLFLGIYIAVALVLLGVHAVMRHVSERCKAKLEILYRTRMFKAVLSKRYNDLGAYHTGELINRLTGDVSVISDAVTGILPNVVMMTVRLVCAMVVLIRLRWEFALFFAAGGVVIFSFARVLKRKVQQYHKAMQQADGRTRSFWQEIFENILVVKAFAGEKNSVNRADRLMTEHYKLRMKRSVLGTVSMLGTSFVIRLGHLFAIGYGAFCLFSGTMDYGTLTALTQLVGQVQQPFANMSGIMPRYYAALSSAERLMEIETLAEDSNSGTLLDAAAVYPTLKSLDVRDVTFAYDRDNTVLENTSVSVHKGDFVSITGMSGIGKSTLFKILLDIYPLDGGTALVVTETGEIPLSGKTRTLFAYVPQGNMLFSGTIRENLVFMSREDSVDDEQICRALSLACADGFMAELPDGLDTVIGENGLGLSEGQIQRIAVARAILSDAPVLLFDEATSALDEATEAALLENLRRMTDKTCIIVTHKKAALAICNRHLVVKDRKIVEETRG